MTITVWQSSTGGNWNTGPWSQGVPGPSDEADITDAFSGTAYTVSIIAAETAIITVLGAADATVSISLHDSLTVTAFNESAGTFDVTGTLSATTLNLSGATLTTGVLLTGNLIDGTGGALDIAGLVAVKTIDAAGMTLQ